MNQTPLVETKSKRSQSAIPWRWILWSAYLILWTTALVVPVPSDTPLDVEVFRFNLRFLFCKSLHLGAYAVFTILSGWLLLPGRFRCLLMFALMAHASVTELFQLLVSSRTGTLSDVVFNHFGIGLGLVLSWHWWTAPHGGRTVPRQEPRE